MFGAVAHAVALEPPTVRGGTRCDVRLEACASASHAARAGMVMQSKWINPTDLKVLRHFSIKSMLFLLPISATGKFMRCAVERRGYAGEGR